MISRLTGTTLCITFALVLVAVCPAIAQTLSEDLNKAKSLILLEATRSEVNDMFSDGSPFIFGDSYSRENAYIIFDYSSGKCTTEEEFGVGANDWNIAENKVVGITIRPKDRVTIEQVENEIGKVKLRKENSYRGIKGHFIFHNKKEGIAVTVTGGFVNSIILFPSSAFDSQLCEDDKIRKYYSHSKWQRDPQPKYVCVLTNLAADIVDLELAGVEENYRKINITAKAIDPENDVLTYVYKVSGGKIIGTGANVTWDLSVVETGYYTITAAADDGCGVCGKFLTRTILVR